MAMNNNQPPVGQQQMLMLTDQPVAPAAQVAPVAQFAEVQQPTEQEMWDRWDDGRETEYWSFMKCVEKEEIQGNDVGNTLLFETDTYSPLLASTNIMTILEEVTARMGNLDSCIRRTVFGYLRVVDFSLTDSQQQKMKVATRDERRKSMEASAMARVVSKKTGSPVKVGTTTRNPDYSQPRERLYNDEKKTKGIEDNKLITICAASFLMDRKITTSVNDSGVWAFNLTDSLTEPDLVCVQEITGQITSLMGTMRDVMNGLLVPANDWEEEEANNRLGTMKDDQKCFLLFILLSRANRGQIGVENLIMRIIEDINDFFLEKVDFGAEEVRKELAKITGLRYVAHLCKYIIYTSGVETMKYSLIKGQRKANEKMVGSPEAQSKLVALFMRADPREQQYVSSSAFHFKAAYDEYDIGTVPSGENERQSTRRKSTTRKLPLKSTESQKGPIDIWDQFDKILEEIVLVETQGDFERLRDHYRNLIGDKGGAANKATDEEKKMVLRSIKELIDFEDKREKEKDEEYEKDKMHETFGKRRSFFTDARARTRTGGNVPLLCENLCNNELGIEPQKLMVSMCLTLSGKGKQTKTIVEQRYNGRTCRSKGVTHTKRISIEDCGFCSPILDLLDTCGEEGIDLYYGAIEDTPDNKRLIKIFNKEVFGFDKDDDITFSFHPNSSSSSGNNSSTRKRGRKASTEGSNTYTLINNALNALNIKIGELVGNESIEIRDILKFESLHDSVKLEMIAIADKSGGGGGFIKLLCKIMAYNILEEIQEITKLGDDDEGIDMEFTEKIYESLQTVITKLSPGDVADDWRQTVGWLSSLFAPITRDGKLGRGVELEHLLAIAVQIIVAGGLPEATTEEGKKIIMQMLMQHIRSFPSTEIKPGLSLALMGLTEFTAKLGKFLFSDPNGGLTRTTIDDFYDFFTSRYHLTKNELLLSYMDPNQIKSDLNMIRMSALGTMNGGEPIFRPDRTTVVNFTYSLVSCITTANQDILRKAAMVQLHKCVIEQGNVSDRSGNLKAIRIVGDRTKVLETWMFGLTGGTQVVSGCQLDKEDVVIFYREDPDVEGEIKIYMKILLKEIKTEKLSEKLADIQEGGLSTPEIIHIERCMYTKLRHRAQDGKLLKKNNDPNSRTVSLNRVRTKEKFFWENLDEIRVREQFSEEEDFDLAFETGCICLDSISGRSKCISRGDKMQAKLGDLEGMSITNDLEGILNEKMIDKPVELTVVDCGFSLNTTDIAELLDEYKPHGLMGKAPTGNNDSMQDFHTLCNHKGKSKFILCELKCRSSVQVELKAASEIEGALVGQYQLLKSGHEYFQKLAESVYGEEDEDDDDNDDDDDDYGSVPDLDDDDENDMETVDGGGVRKSIRWTRRHKKKKGNTRRKRKYFKKTKKRKRRRKKRTRRK